MTWPHFQNEADLPSPALVLHLERIDGNLRRMVAMAGDPSRLRPHLKTHKIPQILARQLSLGISKCKAATIAEAEMAAATGAPDVLLAAQPVGPSIVRFIQLHKAFPQTRFSALCDSTEIAAELAKAAQQARLILDLYIDLNVGQNRTGVFPDDNAAALAHRIAASPTLKFSGLHAYDGHLHQTDFATRAAACEQAFEPVWELRRSLLAAGIPVPGIVAGGTPTFPIHARRPDVECSPGTPVLWDAGYASKLPDLDFLPAATLLTRVISRPGPTQLCLDLGHKAVGSEMPHPRVLFPELPDAKTLIHSEEHLVIETQTAPSLPLGSILHAIPWHICPTVALHSEVFVQECGTVAATWPVVARARRITI